MLLCNNENSLSRKLFRQLIINFYRNIRSIRKYPVHEMYLNSNSPFTANHRTKCPIAVKLTIVLFQRKYFGHFAFRASDESLFEDNGRKNRRD